MYNRIVWLTCGVWGASRDGAALYGFGRGLAREVGVEAPGEGSRANDIPYVKSAACMVRTRANV